MPPIPPLIHHLLSQIVLLGLCEQKLRLEEAKSLMRKTMPVAQRVLRENHEHTLKMRWSYAVALYKDPAATLDDLHEALETLESVAPTWKRVFGGSHPETPKVYGALKEACGRARALAA